MSETFHGWASMNAKGRLEPFSYKVPDIGPEQVQIRVESCGICHSDLSMIDNDWGMTAYPLIAGHEAIGIVESVGDFAKGIKVGDRVGLGWFAGSCMSCRPCLSGRHQLCGAGEQTIVGRHGGFADRVRCHWSWAIPLPAGIDPDKAGPLFCGGITVFAPIADLAVKPTQRVGVIGIGGLGHLALQFLNKWGCHVTAFTSSDNKMAEAKALGAHEVLNSRDSAAMKKAAGSFDFILSTVNVPLAWDEIINLLAADGTLDPVQEGFMQCHGLQCGFCTPGMMICARALLNKNPDPTEHEIREAISGQICRCTGYTTIVRSIQWAAKHPNKEEAQA
jgi:uncharacterized zinc-type alcohol dehydrogenase-like protein